MGAGENTHHRNDDDTNQRVFDINTGAWIFQFVKIINNIFDADTLNGCHDAYSKNLGNGTIPKGSVGKISPWRKSPQIARITQDSRWP